MRSTFQVGGARGAFRSILGRWAPWVAGQNRSAGAARLFLLTLVLTLGVPLCAGAQDAIPLPSLDIGVRQAQSPRDVAVTLQILFLMTILSLAPAILILTTSFTRIIIVLSFLRRALGTQETPSNQILIGLALFMTFFIMTPTWQRIHQEAIQPYMNDEIKAESRTRKVADREVEQEVQPFQIALERALAPMRDFMWQQLQLGDGAKDVALFMDMGGYDRPATRDDVPTTALIPAFVISELKKAFILGFVIFLPFLVIDIVTASVLMSMGMMMLPPILISLPFKVLLFVLVDGWHLLALNLGRSFISGG